MKSEREEVKNGGVEEEERELKRKREKERSPPLDELEDDAFKGRGKHSRNVEVRRDCPYLDTVNRQVKSSSYLPTKVMCFVVTCNLLCLVGLLFAGLGF